MKKGFSIIELLIIIAVVAILGTISWIVYNNLQTKPSQNIAPVNYSPAQDTTRDQATATPISSKSCTNSDESNHEERVQKLLKAGGKFGQPDTETAVGSECLLDNGDTIFSFNLIQAATSSEPAFTHGIVIISGADGFTKTNSNLTCAKLPPNAYAASEITAVIDSKATIHCPGYEGAWYTYDLVTNSFAERK